MLKADVALRGGGERAVRLRLLRQVEQLEHAAGGRLGVLQVAEAACDLLQRAGELLGIQQDRHDDADGHALIADDEPAAEQADGDVGQRIREGRTMDEVKLARVSALRRRSFSSAWRCSV